MRPTARRLAVALAAASTIAGCAGSSGATTSRQASATTSAATVEEATAAIADPTATPTSVAPADTVHPSTSLTPAYLDGGGNLGTNLGGVNYWDGVMAFANLMDQASDWVPQAVGAGWGEGPALTVDQHCWPRTLASDQFASAVLA